MIRGQTELSESPDTIIAAGTNSHLPPDGEHLRSLVDHSSGWSDSETWIPASAWDFQLPIMEDSLLDMDDLSPLQNTNAPEDANFEEQTSGGEASFAMAESSLNTSDEPHSIQGPIVDNTATEHRVAVSRHDTPDDSSINAAASVEGEIGRNHDTILWDSSSSVEPSRGLIFSTPTLSSTTSPAQTEMHPKAYSADTFEKRRSHRAQSERKDVSKANSKCVIACAHILATLETYLLSELKTLDLVLGAVHKATEDLKQLVKIQEKSRCERCVALFTPILSQIIDLLEAGTTPLPDDGVGLPGSCLSGIQTEFIPTLGFGAFQVTAEEQLSWRSRIVLKEYRHVGEVLSSVTELAGLGPRGSSSAPEMVKYRTDSHRKLEARLKSLCERTERDI